MSVYEPCNLASNVAYYHAVTRLCDQPHWVGGPDMVNAMKRSFAILAVGSSIMHGSHTFFGYNFDMQLISLISYLIYQNSVASIAGSSPIIRDLSEVPRNRSGVQMVDDLVVMFATQPLDTWAEEIYYLEMPGNYFIPLACCLINILNLLYPQKVV